jgi:hypothetical protein
VERVDITRIRHAQRQRWRAGDEWDPKAPKIAVGEIHDGGWYVERYDGAQVTWPKLGSCRYDGPDAEWYARRTAARWMRTLGGEWAEA